MKFSAIFLTLMALFISTACTRDMSTEPGQVTVRDLSKTEKKVTKASDDFGLQLLQKIAEDEENNIFISPLSVSMALGMTLNGAHGETESAMQSTIGFDGMSPSEINAAYQSLIKLLTGIDPKVQFEIANSIWSRSGFSVEQDFINTNKTFFDALVTSLDFSSAAAPTTINKWVDNKTHGKIAKIVDQIPPDAVMYLINAIYFKGTWTYEFKKSDTQDETFFVTDNDRVQVPFMRQTNDKLPYQQNELFQAVDLPYGNEQFRMTIILPAHGKNIDEIIGQLDSQTWNDWMADFRTQKGTLQMPKFKLEYKKSLVNVLSALGMGAAFGPSADFTGINKNGNLVISEVLHKTFVDVYEEGTEAAAVTSVEISLTSVGGSGSFFMRVDRPFLFAIREQSSGTILFIGRVNNPA